ncbi:arginase [Malassezia cuniculi]|uniref:Arginase n=1 Tax=Malassezia cuniculi TaxID=948313 RepID=A0AAF0J6F9_9BASI|nr:arginase [Malassezia cuniculi]
MSSPLLHVPSKSAVLIKCPFSGGQPRKGVEKAPSAMVAAAIANQVKSIGWEVSEDESIDWDRIAEIEKNDEPIGKMKNPNSVSEAARSVSEVVERVAKSGKIPVTLGGDHSLGLGTVIGITRAHPETAVIWVDAHADINTPDTTDSGNLHGCPMSFALGLEGTYVTPFKEWIPNPPVASPQRLVYIGLRDIDEGERKILHSHHIKAFTMHHVDKYGIGRVVEMALDHVNGNTSRRDRPIHLSFDVDALDPTVAPSTGTPVRGGLTFREGHYICEAIHETGALVGLDLVEVNPSLKDPHEAEQTVAIGCSLVRAALGESLL